MKETCGNCKFSRAPNGGPSWTCHRYSPTRNYSPWAVVKQQEWCGEWQSRCIANVELRYHEPVAPYVHESGARKRGLEFIRRVRTVMDTVKGEYSDLSDMPRGVAFHLLVMLDGQLEGDWDDEYRVQVKCGDTWENMEFSHHDL